MSFHKESDINQHQRRISFSESQIKDQLDLFQSNEIEPNSANTNYNHFNISNTNNIRDQYFNFNLKTLPTDSIEDISLSKALHNISNSNVSIPKKINLKYSDENVNKLTSSDLIELDNRHPQMSHQNQIFISQNYISTNSLDEVETSQRVQTLENLKNEPNKNIFNNNFNNRYCNSDIMKTTLNTLKYINIVSYVFILGRRRRKK